LTDFRYDDMYAEHLLAQHKRRVTWSDHLSSPLQQPRSSRDQLEQGNKMIAQSDQEEDARILPIKKPEAAQDGQG